jgi:hypothetical protein
VILFVVRPLAGWIGLAGHAAPPSEKAVIAFFGIRGLGSFYYVAYALGQAEVRQGSDSLGDDLPGGLAGPCFISLLIGKPQAFRRAAPPPRNGPPLLIHLPQRCRALRVERLAATAARLFPSVPLLGEPGSRKSLTVPHSKARV